MIHGVFFRGDKLALPNNITDAGAEFLLNASLIGFLGSCWLALVNCPPKNDLRLEELNEPTIGIGGYLRKEVQMNALGWPNLGHLAGTYWRETVPYVWTPEGSGFDKPITRAALVTSPTDVVGDGVISLSAPLPEEILLVPETPEPLRTFSYRLYSK